MATDTPNFNWPIPEDTDLVKDGAKAIRDLGNAIDTSAEDFAGGLVHIKQETGTNVSAIIVNDCFSAEYNHYEIVMNIIGSSSGGLLLRVRSGTTPLTGSVYQRQRLDINGTNVNPVRETNQTSARIGSTRTVAPISSKCFIGSPFLLTRTSIEASQSDYASDATNQPTIGINFLNVNNDLSYDGFELFGTSGTITGTVDVFGYKLGS
jgi:hypothetical protein